MDEGLQELYQEIILDHNKNPRNAHVMEEPSCFADGHNPMCGDEIQVFAKIEGQKIADLSFVGQGCAISKASASLMTTKLKGKTFDEIREFSEEVYQMLTAEAEPELDGGKLGDLVALSGVRKFPARIKCATLAWHALEAALAGNKKVSTE